jgi:hypothetical protein
MSDAPAMCVVPGCRNLSYIMGFHDDLCYSHNPVGGGQDRSGKKWDGKPPLVNEGHQFLIVAGEIKCDLCGLSYTLESIRHAPSPLPLCPWTGGTTPDAPR